MNRRRFLHITAAACAAPAATLADAAPAIWKGRALGTDAQIAISGLPEHRAALLWPKVEKLLDQIDADFSLHRASTLTRLNETGHIANPTRALQNIIAFSDRVHKATNGVFDPSIQPLWLATARSEDTEAARENIGWSRVQTTQESVRLQPGMALTFNGIAQGFAADVIAEYLYGKGLRNVLVDMGEVMALGQNGQQPWRIGIAGPEGAALGETTLSNRALATSSPRGTLIGKGAAHILHPKGRPSLWSTVSVSGPSAAIADALSTAFCLMDRAAIDHALTQFPQTRLAHIS
ncbi:MAG: FAD:protein FMN transferase [Pseudorhodobacter sp.]